MYIYLICLSIILCYLIIDLHGRLVFLYRGYPKRYGHGKTGKKYTKHYKTNWTLFQRIFWIPVFREKYESKFEVIAFLSYIHAILSVLTLTCFLVEDLILKQVYLWKYVYVINTAFVLIKFRYQVAVSRSTKTFKRR